MKKYERDKEKLESEINVVDDSASDMLCAGNVLCVLDVLCVG